MTYFADLTGYSYDGDEPNVINIGWLDKEHPFVTGRVSSAFLEALLELCRAPILLHRGQHACQFCQSDEPALGNGQIRVRDHEGTVFAAPVMIGHYVMGHRYRPPAPFMQAVLNPREIIGEPNYPEF